MQDTEHAPFTFLPCKATLRKEREHRQDPVGRLSLFTVTYWTRFLLVSPGNSGYSELIRPCVDIRRVPVIHPACYC